MRALYRPASLIWLLSWAAVLCSEPSVASIRPPVSRLKSRGGGDKPQHLQGRRGGASAINGLVSPEEAEVTPPPLPSEAAAALKKTKDRSRRRHSTFRDTVFPLYGGEVPKFFAMGMIKFLVVFVLTITRDVKDTLIVTNCGAESIAFVKVYGVLPAAALFTVAYSKMANVLSKDALYYSTCIPFFLFYLLFDLVIYPNRQMLHDKPAALFGFPAAGGLEGLSFLTNLFSNWTYALYYIVSEIYSSVSIGLLFWQFANDIITVDEAKRFYPLFGQLSSIAPVIAGQCVARVAKSGDFAKSLRVLTVLTTLCGIGIVALYRYCTVMVGKEARLKSKGEGGEQLLKSLKKAPRPHLTLSESLGFLLQSRYLGFLCTLVLGFGLAINFTDILWKSMVKLYFSDVMAYQSFMGNYSTVVGATTFVVIFLGGSVVKHLGWRIGALATPVIMALLAAPFFGAIFFRGLADSNNKATLLVAVVAGALQSVLSKATKYALFDPTTQMAYIPLDDESKVKGKAAIDVLGSRVGKSLGALLLQVCVVYFGNALRASYVVGAMFYAVIAAWTYSANELADMFEEHDGTADKKRRKRRQEEEAAAAAAKEGGGGGGGGAKAGAQGGEKR